LKNGGQIMSKSIVRRPRSVAKTGRAPQKVKDLMKTKFYRVNIDTPLKEIINELPNKDNPEFIIVINYNDDIAGIITLSDLFRFIFPDYNEIREHNEYIFDPAY